MEEGRLAWLASYIVEYFHNRVRDEAALRVLGHLLVEEILLASRLDGAKDHPLPAHLQRILAHVHAHLDTGLTVKRLATIGKCSRVSVHRLFHRFIGTAPHRFMAELRMVEAKRLLRTTQLPISAIGSQVGFTDPFHFSRFFRRKTGISPRIYRQRSSIL
jgi:transcriptional regulator GlxA family with amidase domain